MELFSLKYLQCLALLFICVTVEYTVNGIECYDCNSGADYNGTECTSSVKSTLDKFKVLCYDSDGFVYTRCRTTIQTVLGETRTIRSCATAGYNNAGTKCIDRIGTADVKVRYCECTNDLCNSSTALFASLLLVAIGNAIANSAKMVL